MTIVQLIKEFARTHQNIKSFNYAPVNRMGAGNTVYPTVWVEDPLRLTGDHKGLQSWEVNVAILGQPGTQAEEPAVQTAAMNIGQRLVKYLNDTRAISATYSALTLREYYDDDAAGARYTLRISTVSGLDLCLDPFDPEKQLQGVAVNLPQFDLEDPEGCAVFAEKVGALPNFTLR